MSKKNKNTEIEYDPIVFEWGFDKKTIDVIHKKSKLGKYPYDKVIACKDNDKGRPDDSYVIKLRLESGRIITHQILKKKLIRKSRDNKLSLILGKS